MTTTTQAGHCFRCKTYNARLREAVTNVEAVADGLLRTVHLCPQCFDNGLTAGAIFSSREDATRATRTMDFALNVIRSAPIGQDVTLSEPITLNRNENRGPQPVSVEGDE